MRDFRKYDVWVDGIDFVTEIYTTTMTFPSDERFSLMSQMRRSAVSIPSNIAEGSSRKSNTEFARFIEISLGSAFELETQIIVSLKLKYITSDAMAALVAQLHSLQRRLNALRTTLQGQTK
jgi:four helix bundle protein